MNQQIESLYSVIANGIYNSIPKQGWVKATYSAMIIDRYMEASGKIFSIEKNEAGINIDGMEVFDAFEKLREEMAKLNPENGAWYTATFNLTPDGNFKFDFDYDHLPAFDIIPSPDKWADEFKHYPRPELQAHVQDWMDKKAEHSVIVARLRELQLK